MAGGTIERHIDDEYLMTGTHRGVVSTTLCYPNGGFRSCGAIEGLYIENVTQSTNSIIATSTEEEVTTDDAISWLNGDVYRIYKTGTKNSFISSQVVDRSRGWKTDPANMINGVRKDDIDEDGKIISGKGTSVTVSTYEDYFIFTVETTSQNELFTLPLESTGTYDFVIDWGGGNTKTITEPFAAHTFISPGIHTIMIVGTIYGFCFNNNGDSTKLYEIKNWGTLRLGNSGNYFYGCSSLTITATDELDLTGVTTFYGAFRGCSSLTSIPKANEWDVSSVTTMKYMFRGCYLFNQNISSWDVSSVTDMYMAFYLARRFNQNLSSWDVSSVTTMHNMFRSCLSFNQNLGSWDITSVTAMAYMFDNVTLTPTNYDALLIGWEAQAVNNDVTFHGGDSKYNSGDATTARTALANDHLWVITDGGQV